MPLTSIPPLDMQTEHLDRDQYPSNRMLLLVSAIAAFGLVLSWAVHRDGFESSKPVGVIEAQARSAAVPARGEGPVFSRVLAMRK